MKEEKTYHIDVTPEEDALFNPSANLKHKDKPPVSFAKVLFVVLGVHVALGIGILATTGTAQAKQKEPIDLTQPVAEIPALPEPQRLKPTPTPSPSPTPETVRQLTKIADGPTQAKPSEKYVKEYIVKQGDTLYNIAKRYKLNTDRLVKINNIKDANKLVVGQKLKFM